MFLLALSVEKVFYIFPILSLTLNFLYAKEQGKFLVGITIIIQVYVVGCKKLSLQQTKNKWKMLCERRYWGQS